MNRHDIKTRRLINIIEKVLKTIFGYSDIKVYDNRLTFRCPICGDSKKDPYRKMRGNWYYDGIYVCFNCNTKMSHKDAILTFIKIANKYKGDNTNMEDTIIGIYDENDKSGHHHVHLKSEFPTSIVLLYISNRKEFIDVLSQHLRNIFYASTMDNRTSNNKITINKINGIKIILNCMDGIIESLTRHIVNNRHNDSNDSNSNDSNNSNDSEL